jgi:hypothetical protein
MSSCMDQFMSNKPRVDDATKQLMAALVRMPPKPHEEMKLGKAKAKRGKSPAKRKPRKAAS